MHEWIEDIENLERQNKILRQVIRYLLDKLDQDEVKISGIWLASGNALPAEVEQGWYYDGIVVRRREGTFHR